MPYLLMTAVVLSAIPVLVFFIEVLAAVSLPQREFLTPSGTAIRRRIAVLIPAHNESSGLLETLRDVKAQFHPGDRMLVVADNCTDDTAAVAKTAGAEVTERHDLAKVGKGFALDWGLQHLRIDPPEIVIILDADCRLRDDALDRLVAACVATGHPIQALNLQTAPLESPIDFRPAEFAFRIKNLVRPLGLRALNLPCQLMGTGMAFPWEVILLVDLANGQAVEDLRLGLDLARAGHPPLFCPLAGVTSQFPLSIKGAETQRKRWEQGHISTIAVAVPRLAYECFSQRNFCLLALTLDVAVPPLTLLGMLVSLMLALSVIGVLFGLPFSILIVSAITFLVFLVTVIVCWLKFGQDILPFGSVSSAASYVLGKFPLYHQILSRGGSSEWIRTDRGDIKKDAS